MSEPRDETLFAAGDIGEGRSFRLTFSGPTPTKQDLAYVIKLLKLRTTRPVSDGSEDAESERWGLWWDLPFGRWACPGGCEEAATGYWNAEVAACPKCGAKNPADHPEEHMDPNDTEESGDE